MRWQTVVMIGIGYLGPSREGSHRMIDGCVDIVWTFGLELGLLVCYSLDIQVICRIHSCRKWETSDRKSVV